MTDMDHKKFTITLAADRSGITFGWRRWDVALTPLSWQLWWADLPRYCPVVAIRVLRFGPLHVRYYPVLKPREQSQ